jgi:membrane protein insertase Oxa1/YidC/SpoIIIJ
MAVYTSLNGQNFTLQGEVPGKRRVTNALLMIYKLIGGNFGIAIILFTILIRLITHPLMVSQIKGSTKMQEMQNSPEWQAIQKKFKVIAVMLWKVRMC